MGIKKLSSSEPTFVLEDTPENAAIRLRLDALREEAAGYMQTHEYSPPESPEMAQSYYRLNVLNPLLRDGTVNTQQVGRELLDSLKSSFNYRIFERVCAEIFEE